MPRKPLFAKVSQSCPRLRFSSTPNWDAVTDNSGPLLLGCDDSVDGFGATPEQEQGYHTIGSIVLINHATIESAPHRLPLNLEAGSIAWSIKHLGGYLSIFECFRTTRRSKRSIILQNTTSEYSGGYNASPRTASLWNTAKVAPTGTLLLARLPSPARELERSSSRCLAPSVEEHVFTIRSHGVILGGPSVVHASLCGQALSAPSSGLGELPFSLHDFRDFGQHGPRKRDGSLDAPSGEYLTISPPHVASRGPR